MSTINPEQPTVIEEEKLKDLYIFLVPILSSRFHARCFYEFEGSGELEEIFETTRGEFYVAIYARAPAEMQQQWNNTKFLDRAREGLWRIIKPPGCLTYNGGDYVWEATWSCDVDKEWTVKGQGFTVEYKICIASTKPGKP